MNIIEISEFKPSKTQYCVDDKGAVYERYINSKGELDDWEVNSRCLYGNQIIDYALNEIAYLQDYGDLVYNQIKQLILDVFSSHRFVYKSDISIAVLVRLQPEILEIVVRSIVDNEIARLHKEIKKLSQSDDANRE